MADNNTQSSTGFVGDAEAVLATSENADAGIKDLVDAYKSSSWDKPEVALQTVEEYANKLRQKHPEEQNLLSPEETMDVAPVKPKDVNYYLAEYEKQNLEKIQNSEDPMVRAYKDTIGKSIEDVVTSGYQQANNEDQNQFDEKISRMALGAVPGIAKTLGFEKLFQRNLRADSNDTFASSLASGGGSLLGLPIAAVNLAMNSGAFGAEQYDKSRAAGASMPQAILSGSIEATNQALDVILDKVFLGSKERKVAGAIAEPVAKKLLPTAIKNASAEGFQEYVQNKVSDYAEWVGLSKDQIGEILSKDDIYAAATGAIVGAAATGGEHAVHGSVTANPLGLNPALPDKKAPVSDGTTPPPSGPPPAVSTTAGLENELGLSTASKNPTDESNTSAAQPQAPAQEAASNVNAEGQTVTNVGDIPAPGESGLPVEPYIEPTDNSAPTPRVAVVGEPVEGRRNTDFIVSEDGETTKAPVEPHAISEAGEGFIANEDGTSTRIVNGENKQAHQNAILTSSENAEKIGALQSVGEDTPNGIPVIISHDDLGRPYVNHPYVGTDLTLSTEPQNAGPVMIPESEDGTGHILQYSSKVDDNGNIEHAATLSQGKVTKNNVSTAGAQQVKEISTADKLRQAGNLSPQVENLLGLNEDFSSATYVPTSNAERLNEVDGIFAAHNNNHIEFANNLLQKSFSEVTANEALAAQVSSNVFSAKAAEHRNLGQEEQAEQYDLLATQMMALNLSTRSRFGSDLQSTQAIPITGPTLLSATRTQLGELATAKVAAENKISVKDVENIQKENKRLDQLEANTKEREATIDEAEKAAEERAVEPETHIAELEKEISDLEYASTPAIDEAQKAIDEFDSTIVSEDTVPDENVTKAEKELADFENATATEEATPEAVTKAEKELADFEEGVKNTDTKTDENVTKAQEAVDAVDNKLSDVEAKVAELEKQANDLSNREVAVSAKEKTIKDKIEAVRAKRDAPSKSSDIDNAKKAITEAKSPTEKAKARLELTKAIEAEKLRGKKERAAFDDQIQKLKEEEKRAKAEAVDAHKVEVKKKREEAQQLRADLKKEKVEKQLALTQAKKDAAVQKAIDKEAQNKERTAKKEAVAEAKKQAAINKTANKESIQKERTAKKEAVAEAKKQAANKKAIEKENKNKDRAAKKATLLQTKKDALVQKAAIKKQKQEELSIAKATKKQTEKLRKDQLAIDRARIKAEKATLKKDQEKIQARRERNKAITESVAKYKKEFVDKLTPEQAQKIIDLTNKINEGSGLFREQALKELGETIAKIKGVKLRPGYNPWSTFWQSNVLSSLSTNASNILGNVTNPTTQVLADISNGEFNKAGRFVEGWTGALFNRRTLTDIVAGFKGEIPARQERVDDIVKNELDHMANGVSSAKENDPVRALQLLFGTGKLGKLLSSPAISLRALGAMDAVFSRMATDARIARDAPTYEQYLKTKADGYGQHVAQARNEEIALKKLGVKPPKHYVNLRADELAFQSLPKAQQDAIYKSAKRDVFQTPGGAEGLAGRSLSKALNGLGNISVGPDKTTQVDSKGTVASALGLAARTPRSVDEVYSLVAQGLSQGQRLVINGTEVKGSPSTKEVLGSVVDAMNKNQIVSLKGEGVKPLKYAIGMFVNTGSQVLDLSMLGLPGLGYIDQRYGGKWHEFTADEKARVQGAQIASMAITSTLLYSLVPHMDDEENASVYVYGPMRDEKLREGYKAKGIAPLSIRFGTHTVSYKDIPGINLILGGIGTASDAYMVAKRTPERPLHVGAAFGMAALGAIYTASQVSLFKNLGTFADMVGLITSQQGGTWDKIGNTGLDVMQNMTTGLIPFSGAGRELERFVYGDLSRSKDLQTRMLQNVPYAKFISHSEPALDMFGEPLRPHVYPILSRFIGETKASSEVDWLNRNGYTFALPKAGNKLSKAQQVGYSDMLKSDDPENFEPYLTEDDQRTYIKQVGPRLKSTLARYATKYPYGYKENVQKDLTKDIKTIKKEVKEKIFSGKL